jgi:hypothetical protein
MSTLKKKEVQRREVELEEEEERDVHLGQAMIEDGQPMLYPGAI